MRFGYSPEILVGSLIDSIASRLDLDPAGLRLSYASQLRPYLTLEAHGISVGATLVLQSSRLVGGAKPSQVKNPIKPQDRSDADWHAHCAAAHQRKILDLESKDQPVKNRDRQCCEEGCLNHATAYTKSWGFSGACSQCLWKVRFLVLPCDRRADHLAARPSARGSEDGGRQGRGQEGVSPCLIGRSTLPLTQSPSAQTSDRDELQEARRRHPCPQG